MEALNGDGNSASPVYLSNLIGTLKRMVKPNDSASVET